MRVPHHLDPRSIRARRSIITTAAVALLLAACGGLDGPDGTGDADRGPDGDLDLDGAYELQRGTGPDGDVPRVPDAPVTLVIEGSRWGGTSACNSYGGEVRVDGAQVATGGFAVTEMACMDPDVMASEAAYLAALTVVDRVAVDGDTLVLTGPDTELVFTPQANEPDAALRGTTWVLTELIDGDGPDGAVSSVAAEAELVLDEDGRLAGSTGCNRLMSGYALDGDALTLAGPVATTRMACVDEATTAQERHVLEVLEAGPLTVEITGDRLHLSAPDGRGLAYRAS